MEPWRWDQLRRMGEAKAANLITLMPFIAFALSRSGRIRELFPVISLSDIAPIYILFFGLLFLSVGNLLYSAYVPYQVARYRDDVEYYLSEQNAWWRNEEEEIMKLLSKEEQEQIRGADGVWDRIRLVRYHYRHLSKLRPSFRWMVSSFYVVGFVLVAIPTAMNVVEAIQLLMEKQS